MALFDLLSSYRGDLASIQDEIEEKRRIKKIKEAQEKAQKQAKKQESKGSEKTLTGKLESNIVTDKKGTKWRKVVTKAQPAKRVPGMFPISEVKPSVRYERVETPEEENQNREYFKSRENLYRDPKVAQSYFKQKNEGVKDEDIRVPMGQTFEEIKKERKRDETIKKSLEDSERYAKEGERATKTGEVIKSAFGPAGTAVDLTSRLLKRLKEDPKGVAEEAPEKVLDFTLRPPTRGATSLIKTFTGDKTTLKPETTAEKVFYGNEPVGDIYESGSQLTESAGFERPKTPLGQAGAGLLGGAMASFDVFTGTGKGKLLKGIAKSQDEKFIASMLKGIVKEENIASLSKVLKNVSNEKDVANIIDEFKIINPLTKKLQSSIEAQKPDPLIQEAKKYKSADEFVNSPRYEYHLSTEPNLTEGKTFAEQSTKATSRNRGLGNSQDEGVFSTNSPQFWSQQLEYDLGKKAPQNVYLVEVKNSSPRGMLESGFDAQATNAPQDIRVVKKLGTAKDLENMGGIEQLKKSQLTDIWNKSQPLQEGGKIAPKVSEVSSQVRSAINTLKTKQEGEARGALSNPQLGKIDLVWGSREGEGGGLSKIIEKHPEAVEKLDYIVQNGKIVPSGHEGRINIETLDGWKATIRTDMDGKPKKWLLTAYKKSQEGGNRTLNASIQKMYDTTSTPPDISITSKKSKILQGGVINRPAESTILSNKSSKVNQKVPVKVSVIPISKGINQTVLDKQLSGKSISGADKTAQMRVPSATGQPSRLVSDVSYTGSTTQIGKKVKERGFIESVKNNPETSTDLAKRVEGSYEVKHNKPLQEKSQRMIFNNITEAERIAKNNIGDEGVIMGNELVKHYDSIAINAKKNGDTKTFNAAMDKAVDIVENQAINLTEAGRTVQAASTIGRLSPEGIIKYVKKVARDVGSDIKIPNDKMFGFIRQAEDIQKILDPRERAFKLFDLVDDIASNVPLGKSDKLLEALNLPRAIMATADLSAPFRQGIFTAAKHPVTFAKNFGKMFKYAFSEKAYRGMKADIITSPNYNLYVKHKLPITDIAAGLTGREERFMSNMGEKIPLFGILSRGSNRAYTGFLNKMRVDLFDDFVKTGQLNKIRDEKYLDDAARFVGAATGRGELGRFEDAAKLLNTTFFSPRLMASRMSLINPMYYAKLQPTVRKEALKSLVAFVGTGAVVLSLAKLNGAEVESDPRSADFGKIKIGNTRYDIWGGFQQYARLIGQLVTGEKISTITGKQSTLGEGYNAPTRESITMDFLKSKEAPIVSFLTRAFQGEKFGEKFNLPAEIIDRFIPMIASDAFDLIKEKGIAGLGMAIPGMFGVGSQTYGKQVPMMSKTPMGKETMKWRSQPGLGETILNKITGKEISGIPKDQWGLLYDEKQKETLKKIDKDSIKAKVLETGESQEFEDETVYLKDGIVESKKTDLFKREKSIQEISKLELPKDIYDKIDSLSSEDQELFNRLKKDDENLQGYSPYNKYDNPTSQKAENTRTFKERLNSEHPEEGIRFLNKLDPAEKKRILDNLDNKGNEEIFKKYQETPKSQPSILGSVSDPIARKLLADKQTAAAFKKYLYNGKKINEEAVNAKLLEGEVDRLLRGYMQEQYPLTDKAKERLDKKMVFNVTGKQSLDYGGRYYEAPKGVSAPYADGSLIDGYSTDKGQGVSEIANGTNVNTAMHESLHSLLMEQGKDKNQAWVDEFNSTFEKELKSGNFHAKQTQERIETATGIGSDKKVYENIKSSPSTLANERFAFIGANAGGAGLDAVPKALQKYYADVFKRDPQYAAKQRAADEADKVIELYEKDKITKEEADKRLAELDKILGMSENFADYIKRKTI